MLRGLKNIISKRISKNIKQSEWARVAQSVHSLGYGLNETCPIPGRDFLFPTASRPICTVNLFSKPACYELLYRTSLMAGSCEHAQPVAYPVGTGGPFPQR
jgi:hypothetical protein